MPRLEEEYEGVAPAVEPEAQPQMSQAIVPELTSMTREKAEDMDLHHEVSELQKRGGLSEEEYALQQKVDAALNTAVDENGYTNIVTWEAIALAMELVDVNETFEDYRPSALVKYVRSWQERKGGNHIEIKWEKDSHRSESVRVPQIAMAMSEMQLIMQLTEYGNRENKRANANALETMTLGRHLSIAVKSLQAIRGVMVAVQKLRRMDQPDNPIAAAMPGYICLQDGTELDAAVMAAAKAMEQLEKEYPEEVGPAPQAERTYTHGIHESTCSCGGIGCTKCAPPEYR